MSNYTAKEMKRLMGKAIHTREMIQDGDHVMVAVSGGKDSMSLLWLLRERIKRIPIDYRITAVHVDPGFGADSAAQMEAFFSDHGFDYHVLRSDIGPKAHGPENRENPCFLCSRLRRRRLFEIAAELGCHKLALGHNKDDVIETLFLNICYAGEISTMVPSQTLFQQRFTLIRPLAFADEDLIRRFARDQRFPDFENPCPTAKTSKRQEIKSLLQQLYRSNEKIKGNIFRSMSHVKLEYLLKS